MIRVTFDGDYIGNLQDYYHRNECIREQQYLSQEKLLHLAAFCVSKVANHIEESGESPRNGQNAEAALDAVRQLSLLCEKADQADARIEPVTIVNGQTNGERHNDERHTTTSATPTLAEKCIVRLLRLRAAAGSAMGAVAGRRNIRGKTPRI
ncbi:MAG: hypothetical protein WD738_15460 [Pirellulales bacterium]